MPIGRFRDVPTEMDELERRVAAAQYPEGGVVLGTSTGLVLALVTADPLVVVTPVVGGVGGFWLGLQYRRRKLEHLRAEHERTVPEQHESETPDGERDTAAIEPVDVETGLDGSEAHSDGVK